MGKGFRAVGAVMDEDEQFLARVLGILRSAGVQMGPEELIVTGEATDMEGESVVIDCRHGDLHFSVEQDRTFDGLTCLNAHFGLSDQESADNGSALDLAIEGLITSWKASAPAPCAVQRSYAPEQEDSLSDFLVEPAPPVGTSVMVSVWFQQDPNFQHSFAAMQPTENDGSLEWMMSSAAAEAVGLVPAPDVVRPVEEVVGLFLEFLGTASLSAAQVRSTH